VHHPQAQESIKDLFLIAFCLAYFFLHWLWAFPIWDRYLLPLVPILAILLARIICILNGLAARAFERMRSTMGDWLFAVRTWQSRAHHFRLGIGRLQLALHSTRLALCYAAFITCHLIFFVSLSLPAWNAAVHSLYPVGGDHGAYDGIDQIAAFLSEQPEGTVVYHHWLGWEYDYYLFDGPISLAYWPTPDWLVQDVLVFGKNEPRYVTFPAWESSARVEHALAKAGYKLEPVLTTLRRDGTISFTLYQIQPVSSQ
jgi:hypothetical protein